MSNEEERSNDAKPSNPGVNFDHTQATKALSNGNRIGRVVSRRRSSGRKKQRCKNPAIQALILTKPSHRFSSTFGFSPPPQWRRRTRWRVGLICSWVFGEWVFGFVEENNTLDGIWRKKERKNKKKICVSLSDVLSGLG